MAKRVDWTQAFSVLRAPEALLDDVELDLQIKVVSVWPDEDAAAAEVVRLGALPSARGQRYWWQSTHLYARGRSDR